MAQKKITKLQRGMLIAVNDLEVGAVYKTGYIVDGKVELIQGDATYVFDKSMLYEPTYEQLYNALKDLL